MKADKELNILPYGNAKNPDDLDINDTSFDLVVKSL